MKSILSIQSHVAYGYVGNRAAVFPLQLLGYDVVTVNTVQFSNHTGYGNWTGEIFDKAHIETLLRGIEERGVFPRIDAVLSGYLGDAALGEVILKTVEKIRAVNPGVVYCCDPVMGDVGRGFFVKDTIPAFFRDSALPAADIIAPNQFELACLTGIEIRTREDARAACRHAHAAGPEFVLLTSLDVAEQDPATIGMMLSSRDGRQWVISTPRLPLDPAPNGAGDMTAALFLGHRLGTPDPGEALALAADGVFAVFEATHAAGRRELALIAAQDKIRHPQKRFAAVLLTD